MARQVFIRIDIGAYERGDCAPSVPFQRGDPDADGEVNLTDAVFILRWLYLAGEKPSCLRAADADESGVVDLTDAVRVLGHLFLGGPAPPEPFGSCGGALFLDSLTCVSFPPCT